MPQQISYLWLTDNSKKSMHIWKKASQEELVVRVVIELESMQECEGLFQREALKADIEFIQAWRPFLLFKSWFFVSLRGIWTHILPVLTTITLHHHCRWTEGWLWNTFTPRLLSSFGVMCQICAAVGLAMMTQASLIARWPHHKYAWPPGAAMLWIIKTAGWEAESVRGG